MVCELFSFCWFCACTCNRPCCTWVYCHLEMPEMVKISSWNLFLKRFQERGIKFSSTIDGNLFTVNFLLDVIENWFSTTRAGNIILSSILLNVSLNSPNAKNHILEEKLIACLSSLLLLHIAITQLYGTQQVNINEFNCCCAVLPKIRPV